MSVSEYHSTMGCHISKSQAIVRPRVPLSNESCIRLVRTENKSYQTADAYFLGGYPLQQSFRNRISETEWRRLNIEFIQASSSPQSLREEGLMRLLPRPIDTSSDPEECIWKSLHIHISMISTISKSTICWQKQYSRQN